MKIAQYLSMPYQDGGRTPEGCDCYGLVLMVREKIGLAPLPAYDSIHPDDKAGLTSGALHEMQCALVESRPTPGAIATVWRGKLCIHVGVCVEKEGRLGVLETNRRTGPRWMPLSRFERSYLKVVYLNDRDLPEHI